MTVPPGALGSRADWLLLLLAKDAIGAAGPVELDPIRLQKGMFLLSRRGPARDLYHFRPYDWGPFSAEVYADLDDLTARGYLDSSRMPGRTWSTYRATSRGTTAAHKMAAATDPTTIQWLKALREYLTTRSFAQLLREIYAEYPQFAVNSRFEG